MPQCLNPTCGQETKKCCGACKSVFFCCRECQLQTWKFHKQICKPISAATSAAAHDDSSSSSHTCLVVDGMGPLGRNDINTQPIVHALKERGLGSTVVHVDRGKYIPEQLAGVLQNKPAFRVCVILGWGSGDDDFGCNDHEAFRSALVAWVKAGGCLIVQGERIEYAAGNWPLWFDLAWKSSDYSRTIHVRNNTHWSIDSFKEDKGAPKELDVKACMINNVASQDILFGTTEDSLTHSPMEGYGGKKVTASQSAFAVSRCEKGTVSFFGDINAAKETIAAVAIVAKGSSSS